MKLVNNDNNYLRCVMPVFKDYYRILNVKPSATAGEIKNVYRKLAMKYHPDHNQNDELTAALFADIAEAYNILSDAKARRIYNEQRHIIAPQEYKKPVETIEALIIKANSINKHISATGSFQINRDALFYSVMQLFPYNVTLLETGNKTLFNQLFKPVLTAMENLTYNQTKKIMVILQPLFENNNRLQQELTELLVKQEKKERWEKYKIAIAVTLTILLCAVIFFAAKF